MDENVFECDNTLASHSCAKLYLDAKTADVSFTFDDDTDQPLRIVAHKILLSAGSPVFDTMFYGSLVEMGDIPIVDASPGAFKEFLQFFYKNQVQLTASNIGEVINLCKKYELEGGVKLCEIPLQKSLTNNDMCWGYEIASLLELDELQNFCEKKIKENAEEILRSESFLECARNSLDKILEIVQPNCKPMTIVEACMEWAKAENQRNDLDISSGNLRAQLGELFDRIPLIEASMDQFFGFTSKYRGLFTANETNAIIHELELKKFQSSRFANVSRFTNLECNRYGSGDKTVYHFPNSYTGFESNKSIFLKEFFLPKLHANVNNNVLNVDLMYIFHGPYKLIHTDLISFGRITLSSEKETHIVLPEPVFIEAGESYQIGVVGIDYGFYKEISFIQKSPLENEVKLSDGTEIKFFPGTLIAQFVFQKPENEHFQSFFIKNGPIITHSRRRLNDNILQ